MKTQNTPLANELRELTKDYLTTLRPYKWDNEKTEIPIVIEGGYTGLSYKIQSLIAVCQSAILSQESHEQTHSDLDLVNVLGLAHDLLPQPEMEYLDKMRALFPNEIKKD